MTVLLLTLRVCTFYLGIALVIIFISLTGILFLSFASYRIRSGYVLLWNRYVIWSARWICGLQYEIIGVENIPTDTAFVVMSKHQSQWETFFLQTYLSPISFVLKRELLNVPFFGWGLRLTDPIAINRGNPRQALKQTQAMGIDRIERGISVLIFPEGTRIPVGESTKFARGGANIAIAAKVPVVPIALNAGEFWRRETLLKYPGKITVTIGKPIPTDKMTSRDITDQAKDWIDNEVSQMDKNLLL